MSQTSSVMSWRTKPPEPPRPGPQTSPLRVTELDPLAEAAKAALKASPKNWDGAKDRFYAAVRGDADLLWRLIQPYRHQAAQQVLMDAANELRGERGVGPITLLPQREPEDRVKAEQTQKRITGAMTAVANVHRQSLLETMRISGRPLGDLTPRQANRAAAKMSHKAAFINLLTQNIPMDEPIRKYRDAATAEKLYAEANEAQA